jgi:menaquinone-9 beta-reductase
LLVRAAVPAERRLDVLVIGAGPAGSVAALELARCGCAVLLVDRAAFPRDKVCGCCLNAAAMEDLDALGIGAMVRRRGIPLEQVELCAGQVRVQLPLRGGIAMARSELDHLLVQSAVAAGAEFRDGCSAVVLDPGLRPRPPCVQLTRNSQQSTIEPRLIIVADGVQGSSLRNFGALQPHIARASRIGIAATFAHLPFPAGTVRMTIARGGYVGMVRLPDGRVDLAAAIDPELVRSAGSPAAAVGALLASADNPAPPDLHAARFHGTSQLTRRRPVEYGNILVVGDAAAYIEPFTGEGMAWAIRSARAVCPHALNTLTGAYRPNAWTRAHRRTFAASHFACLALTRALRLVPTRGARAISPVARASRSRSHSTPISPIWEGCR